MKAKLPYVLMTLLIILGLGVLFYPTISNWYNIQFQIQAVAEYDGTVEQISEKAIETELALAQEYNQALTGQGIKDPFITGSGMVLPENYMLILDVNKGIMGTVSIPGIGVYLPIYHGTHDNVLKKGIGHMEMTAFPVGGEGNHSVLTGHTGLPDAVLFTDLIKLELGDRFYIEILGQKLAYKVDRILVVEPTDTKSLRPTPGEDYITLVTCTPYAVNSHRLLVRGTRIPYSEQDEMAIQGFNNEANGGIKLTYDLIIAIAVLVFLVLAFSIFLLVRHIKRKRKKRRRYYPRRTR